MTSHLVLLGLLALSSAFTYNEALAKESAALSFAAYCSNSALTKWSVGYVSRNYPDVKDVQVFEDLVSGTKGFIAYNNKLKAITVVFRGSSNIQNWIENITFAKHTFNTCNCPVHQGFDQAYQAVKDQVFKLVTSYKSKYTSDGIYVMGHSLGGAMGTLCASDLIKAGNKVFLATFGSPRVGSPAFYDWFNALGVTHFRVVHNKDTVPHLPLYAMGFYHVNREIWYTDKGYKVCDEVKGEDKTCSYSVTVTSNADHSEYMGWSSTVDC